MDELRFWVKDYLSQHPEPITALVLWQKFYESVGRPKALKYLTSRADVIGSMLTADLLRPRMNRLRARKSLDERVRQGVYETRFVINAAFERKQVGEMTKLDARFVRQSYEQNRDDHAYWVEIWTTIEDKLPDDLSITVKDVLTEEQLADLLSLREDADETEAI